MRKTTLLLLAVSALTLAASADAPAAQHHAAGHRRASHRAARKHHASRRRLIRAGSFAGVATGSAPSTGSTGSTGTTGTTGTTEPVGSVTSFSAGVLTITLTDGTILTGRVSERTDIGCIPAIGAGGGQGDDDGADERGPEEGTADGRFRAGAGNAHVSAIHSADDAGESDDSGEEGESAPPCSTSLVPGAKVAGAELMLGSSGAVWDRIELIE